MRRVLLFPLLLLLPVSGLAAGSDEVSLEQWAQSYVEAVARGDWVAARGFWLPQDAAAAERLGIRYERQPFKLDSASLLVLERDRIGSGDFAVDVSEIIEHDGFTEIRFELRIGAESAAARSFVVRRDGTRFLVDPTTALTAGWQRRETEFLDLRIQPGCSITAEAVRRLDRFVAETCDHLAVPADRLSLLRDRKLGYFLGDEETVAAIAGAPTRGVAMLQTDAVVTTEPCHLHELAHLLVNFALEELPLFTLPVLQEGTAVALGGRWGRSPRVVRGMGRYVLVAGLVGPEELLTWNDFRSQSADWTYAPAGVFAGFLLDELGGERYLDLYRDLSGDWTDLERLDRAAVQRIIHDATGMDWAALTHRWRRHLALIPCSEIQLAIPAGERHPVAAADRGVAVDIFEQDGWLVWEVDAGGLVPPFGVLVRGAPGADPDTGSVATSRLFAERFPGREYRGELAAAVISTPEIGIYDFRTDLLTAKWVESFCPESFLQVPIVDRLRFRVRADLLPPLPWEIEIVSPAGD